MSARKITFTNDAFEEYSDWQQTDKKVFTKLKDLIIECTRTPHEGKGKPEPLKGNYSGFWSRRITDKDRLIYRSTDSEIEIISCVGHYDDK